ncbi:MAG: UPF0175 family protein [Candidatus Binatia bacterium]|nr:UPF0175 family protein [Candidatus Binatia bacterium]
MGKVSIEIPEDIAAHLRLSPRSLEQELKKELAVHLDAEQLLPACARRGRDNV